MSLTLACAIAVVRGWTRLYTLRMDPAQRDARRAEIESDLWEFHEDARRRGATPASIALHMFLRLLLGMRHDLLWRAEHAQLPRRVVQEALWATAVASVAFVWWLASTLQALEPPQRLQTGGINVLRLLYPIRPIASVPPLPPTPVAFLRVRDKFLLRLPPPPPPPPPEPPWR